MDETLLPSLENLTLIRFSVLLWDRDSVRLASELFSREKGIKKDDEWLRVRDRVIDKLQSFMLPVPLKKKLLSFIEGVGWEMTKWRFYHRSEWDYLPEEPNRFCWTTLGVIDKDKIAKKLVQDERLDIVKRFKIACIHCFEEDITSLWRAMFDGEPVVTVEQLRRNKHPLVRYWTLNLGDRPNVWPNRLEYEFHCILYDGSEVATKYFLKRLPKNKFHQTLLKVFVISVGVNRLSYESNYVRTELCPNVILLLLSDMDQECRESVYEYGSCKLLKCLLHWPWYDQFLQTAASVFEVVPDFCLEKLLRLVIRKAVLGYKDLDYAQLCGGLWENSPESMRRRVISANSFPFLMSELFDIEARKALELILRDATVCEKWLLLFCTKGKFIWIKLVRKEKWGLLHSFLNHCIRGMSSYDLTCLKDQFEERQQWEPFLHDSYTPGQEAIWKKLIDLVDHYLTHSESNEAQNMEIIN